MDKHAAQAWEIVWKHRDGIDASPVRPKLADDVATALRAVEAETIERCAKRAREVYERPRATADDIEGAILSLKEKSNG